MRFPDFKPGIVDATMNWSEIKTIKMPFEWQKRTCMTHQQIALEQFYCRINHRTTAMYSLCHNFTCFSLGSVELICETVVKCFALKSSRESLRWFWEFLGTRECKSRRCRYTEWKLTSLIYIITLSWIYCPYELLLDEEQITNARKNWRIRSVMFWAQNDYMGSQIELLGWII